MTMFVTGLLVGIFLTVLCVAALQELTKRRQQARIDRERGHRPRPFTE